MGTTDTNKKKKNITTMPALRKKWEDKRKTKKIDKGREMTQNIFNKVDTDEE